MPRILFCPLLICAFIAVSLSCFAQTPTPPAPPARVKKPAPPKIETVTWNEQIGESFGASREEFASMGLSKLTQEEYVKLFLWAYERNAKAKEKGMEEGKTFITNTQNTFTCGPTVDETSVAKVSLIIEDEKDTPSALMSGIRQRIRNIPDVQIVYEEKDADLSISIIGFENTLVGSNVATGYSAAVITTTPCISKFRTTEWNFQMLDHALVQTGGKDLNPFIEEIVTTIDAKSIESIRKSHATTKKFLQDQRKPKS